MGLFNKNKGSGGSEAEPSNTEPTASAKKKKFHTRRKKKSLIAQMKISESVPATVIDAVHGDESVINSDKDFVRAQKLVIDDKVYYPVFIMDEPTLEEAGLGERENKDVFGQLSVGLKTSSGATGLLPVVTTDSLQSDFIGLLPMHDAFEVLRGYSVFDDYKYGWPVGLLNIDNDVLTLTKLDLRLTMHQWWDFVNQKLNFKVINNEVKLDENIPESSDPLALKNTQAKEIDTDNLTPTHEFDDDDQKASNSSISSFVNSEDSGAPGTSNSAQTAGDVPDNGFSIDDFDDTGSSDTSSEAKPVDKTPADNQKQSTDGSFYPDDLNPTNDTPTNQGVDTSQNDSNQDLQKLNQDLDKLSESRKALDAAQQQPSNDNQNTNSHDSSQDQPPANNNDNLAVTPVSRDDLEADNAIMSASVRTLNDLNVSISDQEFIDAYLKTLSINTLPMLDTTHDTTGRLKHINELRQQANLTLNAELKTQISNLKSWFETERSSVLDAFNNSVKSDGSAIKKQRDRIHQLQSRLTNDTDLKKTAQSQIAEKLDALDKNFNIDHSNARKAAVLEVDKRYNQLRIDKDSQKDNLISTQIGIERQRISDQIATIKAKIQSIAQTAASQAYTNIMSKGSLEFDDSQRLLNRKYQQEIDKLDAYEKQMRDEENRRAQNDAFVAQQDSTLDTLREQIKDLKVKHQDAIEAQRTQYETQLETVQNDASNAQQQAVKRVLGDKQSIEQQLQEARTRSADMEAKYEKQLAQLDKEHKQELQAYRDDIKESEQRNDKQIKRTHSSSIFMAVMIFLCAGSAGMLIGGTLLHSNNNSNTQQQGYTVPYVYPYSNGQTPATNSNNNTNSSNTNSNSQNDESTSSSHEESKTAKKESTKKKHNETNNSHSESTSQQTSNSNDGDNDSNSTANTNDQTQNSNN